MASKRHTPEQIVAKLRQVDVLTSQGSTLADAVRQIGVTEVILIGAGEGITTLCARTPRWATAHSRPRCLCQRLPRGRRCKLGRLGRPRSR